MNGSILHRPAIQALKVIALDCDGVLFDSKEANVRFYNHILEHVGMPPVRPDQFDYIHMHPVRQSLHYLLGDGPLFEKAFAYCQQIDFTMFNSCLSPEPGLLGFLEKVHQAYHTALATNRTVSTRQVLAYFEIERYFDLVVSASDVSFPKPHPETMIRIMKEFSAKPEEILFVGDSSVDQALAEATGVVFIAYKNPNLKADLHITHFSQLETLLFGDGKNSPCLHSQILPLQ